MIRGDVRSMDISKLENANVMVIWKYTHNDVVSTTSRKTECKIDWKGGVG